jgi:hypothetical protein
MKSIALVAALAVGASVPALALAGPFDGTWKLDTAKSKFTGDTLTYTKTATGYHFSNGGPMSYDFAIDGKDNTLVPGRTVAWSRASDGGWDVVSKASGKVISRAHRTVSADGKTLSGSYTEYRPDGTTVHETDVYTRVSGDKGLAGKWRDTKVQASSDTMKIATSSGGQYQIDYPAYKETVAGKTDGVATAAKGPTLPTGAMMSYKAEAPGKWTFHGGIGDKTFFAGVMTVSADGKTITRKSWVPGKESEASTEVYVKQ